MLDYFGEIWYNNTISSHNTKALWQSNNLVEAHDNKIYEYEVKIMAKKKEETINLENILFKCRDHLRQARNSGSFFEKRDMMLTLVFLRFIGEKFDDGIEKLRQKLIDEELDPDDPDIQAAFFEDATFTDGTYYLPVEARWSTIINTPAPQLNVALDTALSSIAATNKQLKGCFIEGTFTSRNLAPNDIKKVVDEVNKISHIAILSISASLFPGFLLLRSSLAFLVFLSNVSYLLIMILPDIAAILRLTYDNTLHIRIWVHREKRSVFFRSCD